MTTDVVVIPPESTVREAAELLSARGYSGAPVVAGGRVVGVLSVRDILEFSAVTPGAPTVREDQVEWGEWEHSDPPPDEGVEPAAFFLDLWADAGADVGERFAAVSSPEWDVMSEHDVAEIMTTSLITAGPDTTVLEAARTMLERRIHRLIVVENGRLLGVVSATDLLRAFAA